MSSQMQTHLRKYVEDGIQQKVRLGNMIEDYQEQHVKSQERVIDETTLRQQMILSGISSDKIQQVEDRIARDKEIFERTKNILEESKKDMEGITYRMNAHLEELSEIEILAGGFVTHAIGVDKNTTLDKENMIISFQDKGHVEIPIAVRRNKWKDSSQLTLKKIKKAGGIK